MARCLRIGLLGPYHSRNFGDTAIQMAVIANLRRIFPDAELIGVCPDPADTERTHGIKAFPLSGRRGGYRAGRRQNPVEEANIENQIDGLSQKILRKIQSICWGLGRFLNIAVFCRSLDMLLIAGSGQLDDFWGGPWAHPFSLLIWSFFARIFGTKVAVLGIGWDDLSTRLGKRFAFCALRLANHLAFRDRGTVLKLATSGIHLESNVCPDPAFGLETPSSIRVENSPVVIMVCPISSDAWLNSANASYANYLIALEESCLHWLNEGYIVRLTCSQTSMDLPVVYKLANRLRSVTHEDTMLQNFDVGSVLQYIELAREADIVVASRLHALILSAVAETPLVAVSYGRKVNQLMTDLGLQDYCIALPSLNAERLKAVAALALYNRVKLRKTLIRVLDQYRDDLSNQYITIKRLLAFTAESPEVIEVRREQ